MGVYLGPPCFGCALNCHLVNLEVPGTRPLCMNKQIYLFYLYATAKSEIQICSKKHETPLVCALQFFSPSQLLLILDAIYDSLNEGALLRNLIKSHCP